MIAIIALISNYLMTNDAEQYSYAYLPFVSLLQWNAYSSLAKLKKKTGQFVLPLFKRSLYIPGSSPFQIYFANILSVCGLLLIIYKISFGEMKSLVF